MVTRHRNLVSVLAERAQSRPEARTVTFLQDGERDERSRTFAQLQARARAIGSALTERKLAGERALLIFPPSIDYVDAFYGCLDAGVIAVPTYPPDPTRLDRTIPKLQAIARSATPRVGLTTKELLPAVESILAGLPEFENVTWLATDACEGDDGKSPVFDRSGIAFLQYTSGSTASPKGVCVTHENLVHNLEHIARLARIDSQSHAVVWLPPYHDMGLIGGILQPIYGGYQTTLLSPLHFLKRPVRWLEAISRVRGTHSAAPNFAFDLCARKTPPEARAGLDLSSWRMVCHGAEPVRAETIDRFVEAFSSCGFRRDAIYPCYGLAEGTLLVTGSKTTRDPIVRTFDARSLEQRRVVASEAPLARKLVACGGTLTDQRIRIVHPETLKDVKPGEVGEVWLHGSSVAQAYWEQAEETARTFHAVAEDGLRYLRTGDLGFLHEDELYVTGRIKDLIIIRGRNIYPQDVEATVERASEAVRPGGSCAFSIDLGDEQLCVVAEVRESEPEAHEEALDRIRTAVAREHSVSVGMLALVAQGGLPKTSSGKLQRNATREALFAGALPILARAATEE
jgi:acyl-CoA synthetase (AMP-forming)/AMP-acid ligase II